MLHIGPLTFEWTSCYSGVSLMGLKGSESAPPQGHVGLHEIRSVISLRQSLPDPLDFIVLFYVCSGAPLPSSIFPQGALAVVSKREFFTSGIFEEFSGQHVPRSASFQVRFGHSWHEYSIFKAVAVPDFSSRSSTWVQYPILAHQARQFGVV